MLAEVSAVKSSYAVGVRTVQTLGHGFPVTSYPLTRRLACGPTQPVKVLTAKAWIISAIKSGPFSDPSDAGIPYLGRISVSQTLVTSLASSVLQAYASAHLSVCLR